MFQLTQRDPREDMGYTSDFRFRNEQLGLCSPAQGDLRGVGTRVHFMNSVGVPFLKFRLNFFLLRREVRNDLPLLISPSGGFRKDKVFVFRQKRASGMGALFD